MAEKDKMKYDPELAAEAEKMGAYELNPIVTKVHKKFGLFNIIRNNRDSKQVEISKIGDEDKPQ